MKLRPKGMSIDKCAAAVGVSRVTIMKIESDHEHVKFGTVKKYCSVCGIPLSVPVGVSPGESPCEDNERT